jgi:hypothetical protein
LLISMDELGMTRLFDENSFFRAMIPDTDGFPKIGRSARMLGVRVPEDIVSDEKGFVAPGMGGMSVAPKSAWNIPNHRRPRGMGRGSAGRSDDRMYALAETEIPPDKLKVRLDPRYPEKHAFVEPADRIELVGYERNLAGTGKSWKQVWP